MKRTLFNAFRTTAVAVVAAVMSFAVTGCGGESNKSESDAKELKVSVSNINLEAKAASETVDVTAKGVAWTATSKAAWVTVTPASGTGDASVVIAAEANPDQADRYTTVTFAADGVPSVNVTVFQNAAGEPEPEKPAEPELNQNKTMKYAEFGYYGDLLKTNGQCEIVGLTLVDKEVVDGSVELPFDNVSFALALPYKGSAEAISSSLFGTFNCVAVSAMKLPCVLNDASGYSYVYGQGEDDEYSYKITSGTVTVASTGSNNVKIDFDVQLEGGRTYKGTYSGAVSLYDETDGGGGSDEGGYYTNLTGDCTPELTSASAMVTNLTDNSGQEVATVCGLAIVQMKSASEYLTLALYIDYADIKGKDLSGTYNCEPTDAKTYDDVLNTFEPGEIEVTDEGVSLYPSIYYTASGNTLKTYAIPEAGSVKFTKGAGNSYTIELAMKDRKNNAIKGTYTLDMPVTDYKASSASVSALNASAYSVKVADFARPAVPVQKGKGILRSRLF